MTEQQLLSDALALIHELKIRISNVGTPAEPWGRQGPIWAHEIELLEALQDKLEAHGVVPSETRPWERRSPRYLCPPSPEKPATDAVRAGYDHLPRVKPFPADAVQCDQCGGIGECNSGGLDITGAAIPSDCRVCEGRGWVTPSNHPKGRKCASDKCHARLKPDHYAIYCDSDCAVSDA